MLAIPLEGRLWKFSKIHFQTRADNFQADFCFRFKSFQRPKQTLLQIGLNLCAEFFKRSFFHATRMQPEATLHAHWKKQIKKKQEISQNSSQCWKRVWTLFVELSNNLKNQHVRTKAVETLQKGNYLYFKVNKKHFTFSTKEIIFH